MVQTSNLPGQPELPSRGQMITNEILGVKGLNTIASGICIHKPQRA